METKHQPTETKSVNGGTQHLYRFDNGYSASVVRHSFSYGNEDGLWELAVFDRRDRLTYETPITSDVIGYLTEADVDDLLDRIAALPEAPR